MIFKGFKFGMILQIAVGPICIFIFQSAVSSGLMSALRGVLGVALVDSLFIFSAIWGLGKLLDSSKNIKKFIKYFGGAVLIIFGLSIIMGEIGIKIIPSFHTNVEFWGDSIFLKTIFLTLSNPLTIIFWAGVFSAKISEGTMKKKDMYLFGIGAVMSTLLFLSMIAVLGNFANAFLPPTILIWLNIIVGGILIIFGIKTINPSFPFL